MVAFWMTSFSLCQGLPHIQFVRPQKCASTEIATVIRNELHGTCTQQYVRLVPAFPLAAVFVWLSILQQKGVQVKLAWG